MLITVRVEDVEPGDRLQGLRGGERIATTIKRGYKNAEVLDQNGKSSIYEPLGTEIQVDRDEPQEDDVRALLEELIGPTEDPEDWAYIGTPKTDGETEVPPHVLSGQEATGRALHALWNTSNKHNYTDTPKRYAALVDYIDAHPHLKGTRVDPR